MGGFWNWLIGEAGAGWIIGLLGVIGGVYTWLRRERPGRVIVQEVGRIRLLDIHASQRERLAVYYREPDGRQVQIRDLVQAEWVIYNGGSRDLPGPLSVKLGIEGGEYAGFLDVSNHDDWYRSVVERDAAGKISGIRFELDYLNSYAEHEQTARFTVLSEQTFVARLAEGGGPGWSAFLGEPVDFVGMRISTVEYVLLTIVMLGPVCLGILFPQIFLGEGEFYPPLGQNWVFMMIISVGFISAVTLFLAMIRRILVEKRRRWRLGLRRMKAPDGMEPEQNPRQVNPYSLAGLIKSDLDQRRRDAQK